MPPDQSEPIEEPPTQPRIPGPPPDAAPGAPPPAAAAPVPPVPSGAPRVTMPTPLSGRVVVATPSGVPRVSGPTPLGVPRASGATPPGVPRASGPTPPGLRAAGAVAGGMSPGQVQVLYQRLVNAKKLCGEPVSGLGLESLVATINKQAPKIMEEHKCSRVEFTVVIKNDKAILRAVPKK